MLRQKSTRHLCFFLWPTSRSPESFLSKPEDLQRCFQSPLCSCIIAQLWTLFCFCTVVCFYNLFFLCSFFTLQSIFPKLVCIFPSPLAFVYTSDCVYFFLHNSIFLLLHFVQSHFFLTAMASSTQLWLHCFCCNLRLGMIVWMWA